jgi:hypothetical protein
MRREFRLPAEDEEYLDSTGLGWETIVEGGLRWLILLDRPVPVGYTLDKSHTALLIQPGYPDAELDMVYFDPPVSRADGAHIGALATQQIQGRPWQRWSRHRTPQNPWRPGVDAIPTHLVLVDHWLKRALAGGAAA